MFLRMNTEVCGKKRCYKEIKPFWFKSFFFKNWAFFLKFSNSTNSPSSDLLAQKLRIQMENNLGKQYSIGNPHQICHPTLSEEKHLFYRKLNFRTHSRNLTTLVACQTTDLPNFVDEEFGKSGTVLTFLISHVNVENPSRWTDVYASTLLLRPKSSKLVELSICSSASSCLQHPLIDKPFLN